MGQSYPKQGQRGLKKGRDVPARVVAFLRSAYPTKTSESVAADTGLPEGTVRKWLSRLSTPSGEAMLTLVVVYGPEFAAAVAPRSCGWLSKAVIDARQQRIDADQIRINRDRAELGL